MTERVDLEDWRKQHKEDKKVYRPFVNKKKLHNSPKQCTIKQILPTNKLGRTQFTLLFKDDEKEYIADFNQSEIQKFVKMFGDNKNNWIGYEFLLYSIPYITDGYKGDAYSLRVQLV